MKRAKSTRIGLYIVAIIFLSMALFFLSMILIGPKIDEVKLVKLVVSVVIFLGLFIVVLAGALKDNRWK
jgi:succinate-acetate transporter protein